MASFRDSGEAKESKQQGTKASRQKQKDKGRKALKDLRDKRLAGKGVSDVSKYDDKLAKAIQDVDFRNSPIGRSLLADQFQQGLITSSDFQKLQNIQQSPGDRSLAERRQINQLLGLNPTSGMGIVDSLRSGFQGEQFKQDRKRLEQLTKLSPVRQAISSLFGLKSDADPTTAQMLGISPEEDARLRLFSNPDLQNIQFDNLLDDVEDAAPEQIITDLSPLETNFDPQLSFNEAALNALTLRGSLGNLPNINARINANLGTANIPKVSTTPKLTFNPRFNLGAFNLQPGTGGLTNINMPRTTAGSIFQNPAVLNTKLSSIAPVGGATKTTAVAPFQTRSLAADLNRVPFFRRTLPGIAMTALGIGSMMGDQGEPVVGTGGTEAAPNNLTGIFGDIFDPSSELNQQPFMDFLFN